jgi:hypothetical protein
MGGPPHKTTSIDPGSSQKLHDAIAEANGTCLALTDWTEDY